MTTDFVLPDYIRIGYRDFKCIRFEIGAIGDGKTVADIDDDTGLLRYEKGPAAAVAERIKHEIEHELYRQAGFRANKKLRKHEESIVTALACGDLQVMRDNPALFPLLDRMIRTVNCG